MVIQFVNNLITIYSVLSGKTTAEVESEFAGKGYGDFKTAVANEILTAMKAAFGEVDVSSADIAAALEIPPDTAMGDYAFPCFKLSKSLRKSPVMIADALAGAIHADFLGKVEAVKGYYVRFLEALPTVEDLAREYRKLRPDVLIGGFHFSKLALDDVLKSYAEILNGMGTCFYTCHCTGEAQFAFLRERMPRLRYLAGGQTICL